MRPIHVKNFLLSMIFSILFPVRPSCLSPPFHHS
jgi:hypothetical protein